jgi:dTDP-4-dehydrorhamnose 3,5-epimerase
LLTEIDQLQIIPTSLPGVLLIKPKVFQDSRGSFMESYRADVLEEAGVHDNFIQDNHSRSVRNVLRGLHYQVKRPQAKLCRVATGEVFDVAVDIRVGSPTFGKWYGVTLSEKNRFSLYIPKGFAHGFVVRSETADFLYKCSDYFDPADDRGVLWNDAAIGIAWKSDAPILSPKDSKQLPLSEIPQELLPRYEK